MLPDGYIVAVLLPFVNTVLVLVWNDSVVHILGEAFGRKINVGETYDGREMGDGGRVSKCRLIREAINEGLT